MNKCPRLFNINKISYYAIVKYYQVFKTELTIHKTYRSILVIFIGKLGKLELHA